MRLLRPTKLAWLALFLGLSLLLNVALVLLIVQLRNQQPALIAQHRANDRPADPADALKKAAESARVQTNGLPPGYAVVLRGHPGSISAICFAPDCTRLALTTNRGYITVWNLSSAAIDWETEIPDGDRGYGLLNVLAFSPSGDQLAYAVAVPVADGSPVRTSFTVHIRDLQTGRARTLRDDRATLDLVGCMSLAFSPDGQNVAVGCLNRSSSMVDLPRFRRASSPVHRVTTILLTHFPLRCLPYLLFKSETDSPTPQVRSKNVPMTVCLSSRTLYRSLLLNLLPSL
jgi:hypothetical protein